MVHHRRLFLKNLKPSAKRNFVTKLRASPSGISTFPGEDLYTNPYIRAFLADLCLRPSCYQCSAKSGRSQADITIADFWGIEDVCPELDDDKGTSAVMLHSQKAQALWQKIHSGIVSQEVSLASITAKNPSYYQSVKKPKWHDYFMRSFRRHKLKRLFKLCKKAPWHMRLSNRIYIYSTRFAQKVLQFVPGVKK